ncbi:MAG: hypothetical protein QOD99_2603 [Chthoniobacter sp.]|nr:hypothetical protein [Chthoniobacter sp.]
MLEARGYTDAYIAFLGTLVFLRTFVVSEDALLKLWHLETKLLALLHVDSTGSPLGTVANRAGVAGTCRKRSSVTPL